MMPVHKENCDFKEASQRGLEAIESSFSKNLPEDCTISVQWLQEDNYRLCLTSNDKNITPVAFYATENTIGVYTCFGKARIVRCDNDLGSIFNAINEVSGGRQYLINMHDIENGNDITVKDGQLYLGDENFLFDAEDLIVLKDVFVDGIKTSSNDRKEIIEDQENLYKTCLLNAENARADSSSSSEYSTVQKYGVATLVAGAIGGALFFNNQAPMQAPVAVPAPAPAAAAAAPVPTPPAPGPSSDGGSSAIVSPPAAQNSGGTARGRRGGSPSNRANVATRRSTRLSGGNVPSGLEALSNDKTYSILEKSDLKSDILLVRTNSDDILLENARSLLDFSRDESLEGKNDILRHENDFSLTKKESDLTVQPILDFSYSVKDVDSSNNATSVTLVEVTHVSNKMNSDLADLNTIKFNAEGVAELKLTPEVAAELMELLESQEMADLINLLSQEEIVHLELSTDSDLTDMCFDVPSLLLGSYHQELTA
jgi:hypothetical protein